MRDVAFLEREIRPTVQYPAEPLKTPMRRTPIPVADGLLEAIAEQVRRPTRGILVHDLRHYFASLLIKSGADV